MGGVKGFGSCQYIEGSFDSYWGSVSIRKYNIFSRTSPVIFKPVFPSAHFYQKILEVMQFQEIPRISKVLCTPWIFLEVLESAWFVGFSLKSLLVLAA